MSKIGDLGRMGDAWIGALDDGTPIHGVALTGSPDVRVNNRPATRTGDVGIAHTPGGPRLWRAALGAGNVRVNGELLHRRGELAIGEGLHGRMPGSPKPPRR